MLKSNFYKVVVQKWFLNGVIKSRCQLFANLVVNWMTFYYDRKHMLSQATGMFQNLLSCWYFLCYEHVENSAVNLNVFINNDICQAEQNIILYF